jgi:hypothetical protein
LPAIRAEGRHDDVLALKSADGRTVSVLPLALTTVIEDAAEVHHFQVVQQAPDRLALRLAPCDASKRKIVWHAAAQALHRYLAEQSLANVEVVLDRHPPLPDPHSGKLREVIAQRPRHGH